MRVPQCAVSLTLLSLSSPQPGDRYLQRIKSMAGCRKRVKGNSPDAENV